LGPIVRTVVACAALAAAAGCSFSESEPRYQTGLEGLDIVAVAPSVLLPGTRVVVQGRSFIGAPWGKSELVLAGTFESGGAIREVEARVPANFVDFEHLDLPVTEDLIAQLGAREGQFRGTARVEVDSAIDRQVHESRAIEVSLTLATELTPRLDQLEDGSVIFVNDRLFVRGDGILLGGAEGTTYAEVSGCFQPGLDGELGPCTPVGPINVPVAPDGPFDRQQASFPFAPEIAGIRGGVFRGQVQLRNVHASGAVLESAPLTAEYQVTQAQVLAVNPNAVSLGQYMAVEGGGFVGGATDQLTLLHLVGDYTDDGGSPPIAIDTVLVPEFVSGRLIRYVMNEDDDLGRTLRLRGGAGVLTGTITPIVSFRDDEVTGAPRELRLRIAPVKQVVYLHFTPQYVTSLQHFGLRGVEDRIRARVLEVVRRDYRTVNLEVRGEQPDDFSLYSEVEIGGPDPNGLGLLGYDNTPGKDVGNLRLHDRIGGVNAQTQADGYPGYGGVFVDSLFIFSEHPGGFAPPSPGQDPAFDDIFDPFRPDRGGTPVDAEDAAGVPVLDSGDRCPAQDRDEQIACAVWVLGSLIGTTVSHELGHSLGLANPGGPDVHLLTDKPGRLMEAGGGRSFGERAELFGEGPGRFCDLEYLYLRDILPAEEPEDLSERPDCL